MADDYLALLRGINVGGNNIIKMTDLITSFEQLGFNNVKTYINSGNVLFTTDHPQKNLESTIEKQLQQDLDYHQMVVVLSHEQLGKIVGQRPKGFGSQPDNYRYDFIFLKHPLKAKEALVQVKVREGVDTASAGDMALYFSRLEALRTKSYLSKLIQTKIYKQLTIRNWNTTTKLLKMLEERMALPKV